MQTGASVQTVAAFAEGRKERGVHEGWLRDEGEVEGRVAGERR